jgi:nitrite reductase/ring-hydroxylating ferredoxin subunit
MTQADMKSSGNAGADRWILRAYPEPVLIPKERYTAAEFLAREYEQLWPRVWQMACRQEEIPAPGDFVEYTIGDQSALVVRTEAGAIKAFHNVCLHRGRRLKQGCGNARELRCGYHSWCWNLDGTIKEIVDAHTFDPRSVAAGELALPELRAECWGGFVFINFDLEAEPLADFLGAIPSHYDDVLPEDMKVVYIRTLVVEANWKVALEAFAEAYHVQGTHRQMLPYFDDTPFHGGCTIAGLHGSVGSEAMEAEQDRKRSTYSPRLGPGLDIEAAESLYRTVRDLEEGRSMFTPEDVALADAIRREPPGPGTEPGAEFVMRTYADFAAKGINPPRKPVVGDFLIFPNIIGPQSLRAWILFRARPHGNDPDRCIFDIYHLERLPAGAPAPAIKREFHDPALSGDEARDIELYGRILYQDLVNIPMVQKGLHSRGLPGCRPGDIQEGVIRNFHRALDLYLAK